MRRTVEPNHRNEWARTRFYEACAEALIQCRAASGMTMMQLAAACGVNASTIQSIERGQMPMSLYVAARIAEALDVTIDALAPVLVDEKEDA